MPRPLLPPERRRHGVHYRLSYLQKLWVEEAAEKLGCTQTDVIDAVLELARTRITGGRLVDPPPLIQAAIEQAATRPDWPTPIRATPS